MTKASMHLWVSPSLRLWVPEFQSFWNSGLSISESLKLWESGLLNFWVSESHSFWVYQKEFMPQPKNQIQNKRTPVSVHMITFSLIFVSWVEIYGGNHTQGNQSLGCKKKNIIVWSQLNGIYIIKIDREALLITDPPPTNFTTLSNWQNPSIQQNRRYSWTSNAIWMPFEI